MSTRSRLFSQRTSDNVCAELLLMDGQESARSKDKLSQARVGITGACSFSCSTRDGSHTSLGSTSAGTTSAGTFDGNSSRNSTGFFSSDLSQISVCTANAASHVSSVFAACRGRTEPDSRANACLADVADSVLVAHHETSERHRPSPQALLSSTLDRQETLQWLALTCDVMRFGDGIMFDTAMLLDRFYAAQAPGEVPSEVKRYLLAAVLVSLKMAPAVKPPNKLRPVVSHLARDEVPFADVVESERSLLAKLHFKVGTPTAYDFAEGFWARLRAVAKWPDTICWSLTDFLLHLLVVDVPLFYRFPHSVLAAAALLLSMKVVGAPEKAHDALVEDLAVHLKDRGKAKRSLDEGVCCIHQYWVLSVVGEQSVYIKNICKKFRHQRHHAVSAFSPLGTGTPDATQVANSHVAPCACSVTPKNASQVHAASASARSSSVSAMNAGAPLTRVAGERSNSLSSTRTSRPRVPSLAMPRTIADRETDIDSVRLSFRRTIPSKLRVATRAVTPCGSVRATSTQEKALDATPRRIFFDGKVDTPRRALMRTGTANQRKLSLARGTQASTPVAPGQHELSEAIAIVLDSLAFHRDRTEDSMETLSWVTTLSGRFAPLAEGSFKVRAILAWHGWGNGRFRRGAPDLVLLLHDLREWRSVPPDQPMRACTPRIMRRM